MIPVLFESTETKFDTSVSNGLGRLYEATSCICTEKRNGEYYLTMEYPFASEMYKYLEKGRYILAEPSSNYRPQPFEIDTISRPMGGIVTVTAWHISDHLRYIPVMPFTASSCADALNKLKTYSSEPNPFTVWTDKNVTAPFTNKVPRSFKACLGGEENSLLDVFGTAEYEFDMYNVKMHLHRGKNRGVTVRYGVNLKDLKQEDSIANTVTGITPYWHGTIDQKDVTVVLPEKNIQSDKADRFPYHRTEAVDLSSVIKLPEKVKQPTVEMLREAAKTYMKGKSYGVPDVSLTVSYEDLAGTEEYSSDETLQVNLCDTITVIFENLNVNATAEVISVEYDVLKEAYTKLELGSYKDTLSKIIYQSSIMQNNLVSAVQTIESNSSDTESRLIAEYVKQNQIILDDTKATTDALSKKIDDETTRATNAENANAGQITAETTRATNAENANNKLITDHKADTTNPHKVTKAQVGLGNVDNTADSAKSVKYAASAGSANSVAWDNVSDKPSTYPPSGHTHTKAQVGLGNVDNTADSAKSVKYAASAGSANSVAWGNVSGKPSTYPPSSHTHSYLPLSGGTVTGKLNAAGRLIAPTNGGSWVSGKDVNNATIGISTQAAAPGNRWDPIIAQEDYAGGTWNIGSIGNQVGVAGFYKDRTANGTDWYHYIDTTDGTVHFGKQVYANVTGSLSGNASTATKATQDSSGQQINSTYIKSLSVSGRTITYTRGDGKTGTIATQDTNTNTTYTLTKSGYTITLTGSDGSKTSVTDAIGDATSAISNATIDSICV